MAKSRYWVQFSRGGDSAQRGSERARGCVSTLPGRAAQALCATAGVLLVAAFLALGQSSVATAQGTAETPDLSRPLALEELIRLGVTRNLTLAQAGEDVASAQGGRLRAFSGFLPSASADYSYSRNAQNIDQPQRNSVNQLLGRGTFYDYSYGLGLNGGWTLLDLPTWYSYRSSQAGLAASRSGYQSSRSQITLGVKQQYYALIQAQELAKVTEEASTLAQDQLHRAQSLFELGSVAKSDVLQAQVNLATADRDRIAAKNQIDQERARLSVLLAFPVSSALKVEDPPAVPDSVVAPPEESLMQKAESIRPDLQQLRARADAARLAESASKSSRLPSLGSTYHYSKSAQAAQDAVKRPGKDASWGVSLGLSLTLFDGLKTKGMIQQSEAARRGSDEALEALRLQVGLEVREALLAMKNASEGIASARQGVAFAEESVRLQKALYENGGGTLLEWNNAQVELTRAKVALVQAEINLRLAQAGLENATGEDAR